MAIMALEQTTIEIDDKEYLITAMSATDALMFMEKNIDNVSKGKVDLSVMKHLITKYVSFENKQITDKSFDVIFSRKVGHLRKLFDSVMEYNFQDVFQEAAGEE